MKKHNILFLLLFLIAPSVFGIDYKTYLLYPDGAPDSNGYTKQDEQDKDGWWYKVAEPLIKVALPAGTPKANILLVPGGGYGGIAYWNEGDRAAEWFLSQGYAVAVLKYRMPCGNPNIPFEDACQAMTMLRQNAEAYGLYKRGQFGAVGFSAGGHLVGLLATKAQKQAKPDWCVLGYPLVSLEDGITHMESRKNLLGDNPTADLIKEWSVDQNISTKTSAMFIALAQDDDIVKIANSTRLYRALLPMGIYSELFIMPTGGHGFDCGETLSQKDAYRKALLQFIGSVDLTKNKGQEVKISSGTPIITGNRWTVKEKNIIIAGTKEEGYHAYFASKTSAYGEELYVSDLESAATRIVDLTEGAEGSDVKWLTRFNDKAVCQAQGKLYIATPTTMTEIVDVNGNSLENPMGFTQLTENRFVFTAKQGEHYALYISDGVLAKVIYEDDADAFSCVFPGEFNPNDTHSPWCRVGRKVYFKAKTSSTGTEVWVTNGTTEGTHLLKDIATGESNSAPSFFINVDNQYLVFKAWKNGLSNRMWYSQGTEESTKLFDSDVLADGDNAPNANIEVFNHKVYANQAHDTKGRELFVLDPATGKATLANDFNVGGSAGAPYVFGEFDGALFVRASDGSNGLFYSLNGTKFFKTQKWGSCFIENHYAVVNGTCYVYGLPTGSSTWGLYRFDYFDTADEFTLVHSGVACGTSKDGVPVGYSLRSAGDKLVYAVTTGDWANNANNQGVFVYSYMKEDGQTEDIDPDFGPVMPDDPVLPDIKHDEVGLNLIPMQSKYTKRLHENQIVISNSGNDYNVLGITINK